MHICVTQVCVTGSVRLSEYLTLSCMTHSCVSAFMHFLYDQLMRPGGMPNPFYFGDLALDEAFTDGTPS